MKASRFLSLGALLAAVSMMVLMTVQTSFAQVSLPIVANSNTQFGRLSWYANLNSLMGANFAFTGQTAFGVYGQTNTAQGFGIFGSSSINGGYGGAAMSHTSGNAINRGFWALASNHDASNNTASSYKSVALELGANEFAASGFSGLAILVDSGDVKLGTASNTTFVNNLTITGTVTGLTGNNRFTQANTNDKVIIDSSLSAALEGRITGAANTDPVFLGTSAGTGYVFKGTANGTGGLMQLNQGGTAVFDVANSGATSITAQTSGSTTALSVTGSNTTGYTTNLTNTGSTNWASGTGAALNVTHGAYIDSLKVPGAVNFNQATVTMDSGSVSMNNSTVNIHNSSVDFTGSTVTGLTGANKFNQQTTAGPVAISSSTAAGVEIQMGNGANTDPALLVNDSSNATGNLAQFMKDSKQVFVVGNDGSLSIGTDVSAAPTTMLTVDATTGNTSTKGTLHADGDLSVGTPSNVFNVTAATGATTITSTETGTGALSVTNSSTTTGKGLIVSANPLNGYASTITRGTNGVTADTANAALSVTRGAYIDTLNIGSYLGFKRDGNAVADFTNVTVLGFTAADTNAVRFHPSAAQVNLMDRAAIWINQNNGSTTTDIMRLQYTGTDVFTIGAQGQTTIKTQSTTDPSLTVTAQADGKTALTVDGGIKTGSYTNQPAGTGTGTILTGLRTVNVVIANTLVTAASQIVVSAESSAGDSYTATVVARTAGTGFTVKVTCVEGDVPSDAAVTVHYWIVN